MKGQFFLIGFILIGLTLVTLSFTTFETTEVTLDNTLKNDIESSVPEAAAAFGENYRGREFMEMMQYFTQRHKQESVGEQIQLITVAGFEKDRNLQVYMGNYGIVEKQFNITINGQDKSKKVQPGGIKKVGFPISEEYKTKLETETFSEDLNLTGPNFFIINHRYQKGSAVSQDTYIG